MPFLMDTGAIEASLPFDSSSRERQGASLHSGPMQVEGASRAASSRPQPPQIAGRKRSAPSPSAQPAGEPSPKATKYVKKGRTYVAVKPKVRSFEVTEGHTSYSLCSFKTGIVRGTLGNGGAAVLVSLTAGEAVVTLSQGARKGTATLTPAELKTVFVTALAESRGMQEEAAVALLELLVEKDGPLGLSAKLYVLCSPVFV